ncbi:MAG: MarR family winged helix-turn-helix transcriptional regulator [Candidatus Dormibacteria bacterium]
MLAPEPPLTPPPGVDQELLEQLAFRSQLRYVFRRALTMLDSAAAEAGLTPLGYHAVLVLGAGGAQGVSEQELVEQLASSRAHISVLSRSLVEAGLVRRSPLPSDRRRILLTLTARGWEVVATIARRHRERMRELVEGWDPAAFEQLLERIMTVYLGLEGRVRVERLAEVAPPGG